MYTSQLKIRTWTEFLKKNQFPTQTLPLDFETSISFQNIKQAEKPTLRIWNERTPLEQQNHQQQILLVGKIENLSL